MDECEPDVDDVDVEWKFDELLELELDPDPDASSSSSISRASALPVSHGGARAF